MAEDRRGRGSGWIHYQRDFRLAMSLSLRPFLFRYTRQEQYSFHIRSLGGDVILKPVALEGEHLIASDKLWPSRHFHLKHN